MIDATAHAQIVGAIFYHIRAVTEDGKPAGLVVDSVHDAVDAIMAVLDAPVVPAPAQPMGTAPFVAFSRPVQPPIAACFAELRKANIDRQVEWWKGGPDCSLSFRGNELAGEVGEACNILKKLDRERMGLVGSRATKEQLAEELADVVICVDLTAMDVGIDLWNAIVAKFNKTSEARGLATRLAGTPPQPSGPALRWEGNDYAPRIRGFITNDKHRCDETEIFGAAIVFDWKLIIIGHRKYLTREDARAAVEAAIRDRLGIGAPDTRVIEMEAKR